MVAENEFAWKRRARGKGTRAAWAGLGCLLCFGLGGAAAPAPPAVAEFSLEPTERVEPTPELLDHGKSVYERHCVPCHGLAGDGEGEAAYLLYPKPRDFTRGEFRLISTWDGVPTDEDLYRTISRGMPGSAMPAWGHLPERTRWALVHYLKRFSQRPLEFSEPRDPPGPGEMGAGPLRIPPEPKAPAEALRERGRALFQQNCASCHGQTAKGDGAQVQFDSQGYPTRPRDLTAGVFKGLPTPEEVYKRIVLGLPGSPMPTNPYIYGDDAWALTGYVLSLSSPRQRDKVEMKRYRIVAQRVGTLPLHPDAGEWRTVEPVELHLMPLWWRPGRPELLTVKAVHDGRELAMLLQWADATHDHTAMRPQDFRDAVAVELSGSSDPPFFGMGERGQAVAIWMWKAERQADIQAAFQDLELVYPNLGIDSYPSLQRSPLEQPMRHALTLDSDPVFITGWGAGNIVADPTRQTPVEHLEAEGFGTLRARPAIDGSVEATGTYKFSSYQVVMRRRFDETHPDAAWLRPGATLSVAFAVWDGSAGDRDGKKSVTIWQELFIEP